LLDVVVVMDVAESMGIVDVVVVDAELAPVPALTYLVFAVPDVVAPSDYRYLMFLVVVVVSSSVPLSDVVRVRGALPHH
jgi:hypothetical protein